MTIAEFRALRADPKVKERHSTCPVCGLFSGCSFDEFSSIWCRSCRCHWRDLALWRVNLMTAEERALASSGGYLFARKLRAGGVLSVRLLENGAAELCHRSFDGSEDSWYYHRLVAAIAAAAHWNPEPAGKNAEPHGWLFHRTSGRRRLFGDPSRESSLES